jgi:tRNA(fMet)-specific endonuclease VapC
MPASGNFLLDTNIVIALLQGEQTVLSALSEASAVSVPVVVIGELYFGAAKSGRAEQNLAVLDRFAAEANVLPCDLAVAQVYGALKNRLRLLGRPIPENDLWIAAIALQHRLILATRDEHFSHIEDLMVAAW